MAPDYKHDAETWTGEMDSAREELPKVCAEWNRTRHNCAEFARVVLRNGQLLAEREQILYDVLRALKDITEAAEEAWPGRPCVRVAKEAIARAEGR